LSISDCVEKDYIVAEVPYEPKVGLTGAKADGLCKTSKMNHIQRTLDSIKERIEVWLKNTGVTSEAQSF
jgi:SpoVK/Ycf46/Vps4 family AAA+-type ATPase